MNVLRQSTAIDVRVGPFVDATDGVTPETGVTLGGADQAEVLKAGGAATVDISGATFVAVTGSDGWYDLSLTAGHTDTIGELVVVVQDASLCLPVYVRFQVVEEQVYDRLWASGALGPLSAAEVNAEADTALADYDGPTLAELQSELAGLNDPTAAAIADAVLEELVGDHSGTAGSLAEHLADLLADTNELQQDDVPGLIAALNDLSAAAVNAEMVDALSVDTYSLPAQGAPPDPATIVEMLSHFYEAYLGKLEQDDTELRIYDQDGTTVNRKSAVSSAGGVTTRGALQTGP